jgi:hypothetical protein
LAWCWRVTPEDGYAVIVNFYCFNRISLNRLKGMTRRVSLPVQHFKTDGTITYAFDSFGEFCFAVSAVLELV